MLLFTLRTVDFHFYFHFVSLVKSLLLQSGVMSVTFAKFHPNLIVGGTYSGQIVLWDNRSSKKTPVQRTPLSATAHTVSHQTAV